jgi:long-chain acyl-CoA synthetase
MSSIVQAFASIPRERQVIHAPSLSVTWTAANVDNLAQRLAEHLVASGVSDGDLVVSLLGNHPAAVAAVLATRYAGAALLPVDAGATASEVASTIERFGGKVVISRASADHPDPCQSTVVDGIRVSAREGETIRYPGVAMLKTTSGSTGLPKATLTSEENLCGDSASIIEAMGIRPDDVQVAVTPLSHAYAIGNLVIPLLLQGTAIVVRDGFNPRAVADDAEAFAARVWPGVPFMFQHMLEHPPVRWPTTLTHLISAGAPLDAATIAAMHAHAGCTIHSFYGTSETGGIAFDERETPPPPAKAGFIVGKPMPGVTVTLIPDDQAPAGGGRVHVGARGVAAGYAGLQDDAFTNGGFLTGDLGHFDAEGRLVLTGRVSAFVNVAGRKVQPAEVEAVLREADGVEDARVFGIADPRRGEALVACVVAPAGADPTAIRRFCTTRLSPHKVPRVVVTLEGWPLTDRGKLDRAALVDQATRRLGPA